MKVSELLLIIVIILVSIYLGTFVLTPTYYKKTIIEGNEPRIIIDSKPKTSPTDFIDNSKYVELKKIKEEIIPDYEEQYKDYVSSRTFIEKKKILMSMK